jgi:D-serine deaminase-like pyridoxal phosphate-dependent protein
MVTADGPLREADLTPSLVIDLAKVERNIARLAKYASAAGIDVRPHTRSHKSLEMARRKVGAGAVGLTAAKVGEAEVMAAASHDLLIAYPVVDRHRCHRLASLASGGVRVRVAADSAEGIDALAEAARRAGVRIGLLVDLDAGFHAGFCSLDDCAATIVCTVVSTAVAGKAVIDAFRAIEKYLLAKQGISKNALVRGPVGYTLDEETRREVDRLFGLVTRAEEAAE